MAMSPAKVPVRWVFPKEFMPGKSKAEKIAALREKLRVDDINKMLDSPEVFELGNKLKGSIAPDKLKRGLEEGFNRIDAMFEFEN